MQSEKRSVLEILTLASILQMLVISHNETIILCNMFMEVEQQVLSPDVKNGILQKLFSLTNFHLTKSDRYAQSLSQSKS